VVQEHLIERAASGETFTHPQIKKMIERGGNTTIFVGPLMEHDAVVKGDEVRSKTERDTKRGKNYTRDPNRSGHITAATRRRAADLGICDFIEIGRWLRECKQGVSKQIGHGSWLSWLERQFGWRRWLGRGLSASRN